MTLSYLFSIEKLVVTTSHVRFPIDAKTYRSLVDNALFIFRDVLDRNVSNSESDLQGH